MLVDEIRSIAHSTAPFPIRSSDSYDDIIAEIYRVANLGRLSHTVNGCLDTDVVDRLKLDGFDVIFQSLGSIRNNATFVSWK